MKRRTVLRVTGAGIVGGLAGCLGGDGGSGSGGDSTSSPTETPSEGAPFEHPGTLDETFATNGDFPADDDPADGYPPAFSDPPAAPDADLSTYPTTPTNDETVRLAPIDDVYAWYRRGEARFVDSRGYDQYLHSHVYGGVLSPAMRNSAGGGIDTWDQGDRIVTYCGCPHHLSSIRAAGLQKAGFSNVFALDEGFVGREDSWSAQDYPMAGTSFRADSRASVSSWTIIGSVGTEYAGEYVWAAVDRQYEAAPIRDDGGFELSLHFTDVSEATPVSLTTPAYDVTRRLGELASGHVDAA